MLPQTAMRVWGIDLAPSQFFQEEYITKYPRDQEILNDVYRMNKLLLQHVGHSISRVYKREESIPFSKSLRYLVDCQAINLLHHYKNLQNLQSYSVVDYSSLGHRYISLADITPFNHFIRGISRSFKFSQKYDVKEFWNWRMPWEPHTLSLSSFLWKNNFLDNDLLISRCKSFVDKNLSIFPEFQEMNAASNVLLICPHTDDNFSKFFGDLTNLLSSNQRALKIFQHAERVIVKQHRIAEHGFPDNFQLMNRKIFVANETFTRTLPSEILILGMKNLNLFSTISSIIFASLNNELITLGSMNLRDSKDYGLMLGRANKYWQKINFSINMR